MTNTPLLLGTTFDCRTSLRGNTGTLPGYYDTNGVIIQGVDSIFHDFPMSTLRYPANGIVQGFQWKKSIGPVASRPGQSLFSGTSPPEIMRFGFDEFMSMTASRGVDPKDVQIMVPIYDSAASGLSSAQQMGAIPNVLQSNADWVEYANAENDSSNPGGGIDWAAIRAANGHPEPYGIKIWNMGNEPWAASEDSSTVSGCIRYLNRITPMIDSMKAIDSTIKITIATFGNVTSNWNKTIMSSTLVAQGKVYGISPHYFPKEPTNGIANVESSLRVLADTANSHNLKIITGDYGPYISLSPSAATQDSAMQWGGANLCADFLLLMSQIENVERVNFWTYGLTAAVYHPIRRNSNGTYTSMPVAELYKILRPIVLDNSVATTTSSPAGSDGNPYSVRSGAFASNDLSQLNVVAVNRDRNDTHSMLVNGITEYTLTRARILNGIGLDADVITENDVTADSAGNYSLPPMSVLLLEYSKVAVPISFTLTAIAGANGAISPSGTVVVDSGTNATFTFTPATGFHVSGIFIDGIYNEPASSYTLMNVSEDHFIKAIFASNSIGNIFPADTNANIGTQYILKQLDSLRSRTSNRVISGQMMDRRHSGGYTPATEFDSSITSIFTQTGKWVGLVGTDYSRIFVWPQTGISKMNETNQPIIDYFHQGGVVAIMATFKNPWTGGNANDLTGSTNLLDVITPLNPANTAFLNELDSIAVGFAQLQDSGVTVLFRPFHEMNGNWFWWGSKSSTDPIQSDFTTLWQYVFNYLTVTKNLHNILWVYAPSAKATGVLNPAFKTELFYYPGNDYVDIFGLDIYSDTLDIPNYNDILMQGKPLAIAEFGPTKAGVTNNPFSYDYTTLIKQIKSKYPDFIYWMSWNHFVTNGGASTIYYSLSTQYNTDSLLDDSWVVNRDEMNYQTPSVATLGVNDGWNLISVPLQNLDFAKSILFPSATSDAFSYSGGYEANSILENGKGYWLKFNGAQNIQIAGSLLDQDTIDVAIGWNIIGSISQSVQTANIISIPAGITTTQFFDFSNGYFTADSILPGKGYWVKVSQAGTFILSSNDVLSSHSAKIHIVETSELPPPHPDGQNENTGTLIPKSFGLEQNYPNPFNPTTVIRYSLPVPGIVTLQVYTMLGEIIASPIENKSFNAGEYESQLNTENFSTGVYFYRINIQSIDEDGLQHTFTDMKKMLMIK